MSDAKENAPETASGDPLDTDPLDSDPEDDAEGEGGPGPYDADGVIEPEHDGSYPDDDDIESGRRGEQL